MSDAPITPDALLDDLRDHPEWDEARRDREFDRLIAGFPPERLVEAIRRRLRDLSMPDGEILLQLVEGLADPGLFDALADALLDQPDLGPDRLWIALSVLEGTGRIEERPALAEWRDELEDMIDGDDSLGELAAQIEDDPDSLAVAVEGLARVEPDVRAEIIAGLASEAAGPGVLALLRHLAKGGDPVSRAAAAEALAKLAREDSPEAPAIGTGLDLATPLPRILRSAVGSLDSEGCGRIVALGRDRVGWVVAEFACDVQAGIAGAQGWRLDDREDAERRFEECLPSIGSGAILDHHALTLALLGGAFWLAGEARPGDARGLFDRLVGPEFRPAPIFTDPVEEEAETLSPPELAGAARRVLEARPDWRDDSELARRLAVESALREGTNPPDPERDPGPYRILFERRVLGRIELYRRMLLWSALAWEASGERDLAHDAMRIAVQLADPQNVVPAHPFLSALMMRSLTSEGPRQGLGG